MKFVLKPSLEHMALVKIAISLWNQSDVRALISKLSSGDLYIIEKWKMIEEIVIQKVTQLSLPHLLKEKVLGFIKPIGLQISKLMIFHCTYFDPLLNLPDELLWTPQGTVDRKKTAEVLVKDENLDMPTRYRLACIYCMEDDIIRFWNSMPEDLKKSVSYKAPLIGFWSRNMKKKGLGITHLSYQFQFHQSACMDNKVAAEYFLQKLHRTPQEREKSLVETPKYVRHTDVLFFLLSKMDDEQQIQVFKSNTYRVLRCFLRWPCQSFFIRVANCMWDFLSKEDYGDMLTEIIVKVNRGYKDYNYQNLFGEFWQKSPSALKDSIIEEIENGSLLGRLFEMKDKEIIRLILKDATLTVVKGKLFYSDRINIFCENYIRENEWDFLEFFIRECFPSKTELLKFKDEFEKRMYFEECSATEKHKWSQLFGSTDDSICKHGKRSVEEGESSSSKRFQSLQ